MIRLAFVAVLALAGLLAIGAFFLVRGTEGDVPQITITAPDVPTPQAPATPQMDKLYYLRDIAFDQGEVTVVLFGAGPDDGKVIVRDQAALLAAKDDVYVNAETTGGQAAGSFVLALMGASPSETLVQIYRDDALIGAVNCTNTACGSFADNPDINHGDLRDHALPYRLINDTFDDHPTYLDTITAVAEDPDFMLLDRRPREGFPAPARTPYVVVELPTVIEPADIVFNTTAHETRVRDAITAMLPDGATLVSINITDMGRAVLADKDNNQPVTAGGQPIPFTGAQFFTVRARIDGVIGLSTENYDTLTQATMRDFDMDDLFAAFVTERLQTSCVDCYFLKVDGDFTGTARTYDWRGETYSLDYYDLREAP